MNTFRRNTTRLICVMLIAWFGFSHAEEISILDSLQPTGSPVHRKVYPENSLPLDTRLSWINRFNGDKTFNENEVLPKSIAATRSDHSNQRKPEPEEVRDVDGTGVIRQLKTGQGKVKLEHGPIEMGGMFTVLKVREGQAAGDYADPGWYDYPEGTVAYEV